MKHGFIVARVLTWKAIVVFLSEGSIDEDRGSDWGSNLTLGKIDEKRHGSTMLVRQVEPVEPASTDLSQLETVRAPQDWA
jgi:hypothetical protein